MARYRRFSRKPRFRRRRGSGGAWFPVLGTEWELAEFAYTDASFSGESANVANDRTSGPTQNVFPLTRDITQFSNTSTQLDGPSLRDVVEGNTWRLNRLVGKLHVDVSENNTTFNQTVWPLVQVVAGIFVARTGDIDQSLPDLTFEEIDPFQVRNVQNSWIWRNSWILSRSLASNIGFSAVPCTNAWMSGLSSPHIDTKVKRNIMREHRLWFVIGAMGWSGALTGTTPDSAQQPYIRYNLDIRIHGLLKRGKASPTF